MKTFIDYAENLRRASLNQRALIRLLIGTLIIMSATIAYMATHHAQYLIPYGLDKKVAISVHHVTPAYLSQLALADAAVYFNVDRMTATTQSALFLSRVDPSAFGSVEVDIKQRDHEIIHDDISQAFYPEKYYIKKNTQTIVIKGMLKRWLSEKLIAHQHILLTIDYVNRGGQLFIHQWRYEHV